MPRPPRGVLLKLTVSLALVGFLGALTSSSAQAAWRTATQGGTATGLAGGSVLLTNDTAGRPIFPLQHLAPGASATSYVRIAYQGSLPATVRLYGEGRGTGLARFVHLRIVRGHGQGRAFVADANDYVGARAGVIFEGTLAQFPDRFAEGIADPGIWRMSDRHTYRVTVRFRGPQTAEGLAASQSFSWEARPTAA